MNIKDWLDQEQGRNQRLAAHTGRTASAVTQWRTNGVPRDLMKVVRDFTAGEVTLDEMLPDPDPQFTHVPLTNAMSAMRINAAT